MKRNKARKLVLPNPRCTYGEFRISGRYAPTLKSRDYKDPLIVIVIHEKE